MQIQDLFQKDISRPINGVVKADQLDALSVWQELEEFVVTRELNQHLQRFFTSYCQAIDQPGDPDSAGKIGVWVSGFFGSGKSHFIKVLSYLLNNASHTYDGQTKSAITFFEQKIQDAMLLGDIKRAVASNTDVILFNIDSKADSQAGRDAILAVFLKVLNELAGYSGDYPHIAHMERYLAGRGLLETFHDTYQTLTGTLWPDERDAYMFNRDEVVKALGQTLGQSVQSCEKWIDGAEDIFSLTVENFCQWVKDYLDSRGKNHRIVFLVDEVGQFIGTDTHLMLNLQTITEELGTICQGRAWVVVTAQEDIDAVLGEMQAARSNDFSKIQGRFRTRLSLSSANVDEVIQQRLLAKRADVRRALEAEYARHGDILHNQLSFQDIGMTFPRFRHADDFVRNYPFVPYQFKLLQKIFESIRTAGATGLHLAQGERSLLDAFQYAGQSVAERHVGTLVPLYRFYPSIESFLDTAVKRTIDHARDNATLQDFDVKLLEVLFLVRYVSEFKGKVDNLVTLCLDHIDADRLALRKTIEACLQRLERETLIGRSGDTYYFLTNEERDINREIKTVELSSAEEARLLGEILFDDVLNGQRKHRYSANGKDFGFNRICDMHPVGNRMEGDLNVSIITPLADDYEAYHDSKCILDSSQDGGQVLIRLRDDQSLRQELRTLLQTDKYIRTRDDRSLPTSTQRIHRELADENRDRRDHLARLLSNMMSDAHYFVAGQALEVTTDDPRAGLAEAVEYLIRNTFAKMGYLATLCDDPLREIQAVLRSDDIGQHHLDIEMTQINPQATEDIRSYIALCTKSSRQIVLFDMITKRYTHRPYGWPNLEVVLLLARLYMAGEVQFVRGGTVIPKANLYEAISSQRTWRSITMVQRVIAKPEEVKKARELGREIFAETGPEGEDALFKFLKNQLEHWQNDLSRYRDIADTRRYPGASDIADGLQCLRILLTPMESSKFLGQFNERKNELLDLSENVHDLRHFYQHQRHQWDKLLEAWDKFRLNQMELERNDAAKSALQRISEILAAANPYGLIKEAEGLIQTVSTVNDTMLSERRAEALASIKEQTDVVIKEVETADGDDTLRSMAIPPLESLTKQVKDQMSLAHISQAAVEAVQMRDKALAKVDQWLEQRAEGEQEPSLKPRRIICPRKLIKTTYLETKSDVDIFLGDLREELVRALDQNERIEIR